MKPSDTILALRSPSECDLKHQGQLVCPVRVGSKMTSLIFLVEGGGVVIFPKKKRDFYGLFFEPKKSNFFTHQYLEVNYMKKKYCYITIKNKLSECGWGGVIQLVNP